MYTWQNLVQIYGNSAWFPAPLNKPDRTMWLFKLWAYSTVIKCKIRQNEQEYNLKNSCIY